MKLVCLALATWAATQVAHAQAASHPRAIMKPLNLAAMQLTRAEVAEREKKLAPIYQYYSTTNLAQVGNALEQQYGLNVYQHVIGGDWSEQSLTVKKGIMAAAVEYSLRDQVYESTQYGYDGRYTSSSSSNALYGITAGRLFDRVDANELGFKDRILIETPDAAGLGYIAGRKKNNPTLSTTPFTYTSEIVKDSRTVMQGFDVARFLTMGLVKRPFSGFESHDYTLFSTVNLKAVERPQAYRLLLALRRANLKALDATVVFVNSQRLRIVDHNDVGLFAPVKSWAVVYPGFSRVAPIPQPIIYVSEAATDSDLDHMLKSEAPLIFAYNVLFDRQLLPASADLEASISRISRVSPEVAKLASEVGEANAREAARRSFLAVAYTLMTTAKAPVAIAHDGVVLAAHTARDAARFAYQNIHEIGEGITDILTTPTYNDTYIYSPSFGISSSISMSSVSYGY